MHKHITIACYVLFFVLLLIPLSVSAEDDPAVISATDVNWGTDLDNIMITIKTNKDVDQIILKSGQGELLLTPESNYAEEDLRGNNEVMDMNGDLEVDRKDYDILKKHVDGTKAGHESEGCKLFTDTVRCSHCGAADIDGDGTIDEMDLTMLNDHLDGHCSLSDCYFHGKRVYREEENDQFVWSVHYTPTIEGTDIMTITPQAVTSSGVRDGDPHTLEIKAEEYKNPEILRAWIVPRQNKYLINTLCSIYVVTPLECDVLEVGGLWFYDERDNDGDLSKTYLDPTIDFEKSEKLWTVPYTYNQRAQFSINISGHGQQSKDTLITGELSLIPVKFIDPQIKSLSTRIASSWVERWTTSTTDAEGNIVTTQHSRNWYTHTVSAVCNDDVDYVVFHTPAGTVNDYTYSVNGSDSRVFSASWTNNSSSGEGSGNAYATIIVYPPLY